MLGLKPLSSTPISALSAATPTPPAPVSAIPWRRNRGPDAANADPSDPTEYVFADIANRLIRHNYFPGPPFISNSRASQALLEALVNIGSRTNASQVLLETLVSSAQFVATSVLPSRRLARAFELYPDAQDDLQQNILIRRNYTQVPLATYVGTKFRYSRELFPDVQDDLQQNAIIRRNYTAPVFISASRASQVLLETLLNPGSKTNVSQVLVEALVRMPSLMAPPFYRQNMQQQMASAQFVDDDPRRLPRSMAPVFIVPIRQASLFIMT